MPMTRRKLVQPAAMWCGWPSLGTCEADQKPSGRLKIVVAGGHPGDPECGCGGTVARYTDLGHQVTMLYFNRGEAYCGGEPGRDCSAVRTAEAGEACRVLK